MSIGKQHRLARLSQHADHKYLFVPIDHSVSDGPIATTSRLHSIVSCVATAGADAVIMHKGRIHELSGIHLAECSLIVHLSASTARAPDPDAKVLVGSVEEAVHLGADAVSIHINIGSMSERDQLKDFGHVSSECNHFGIPLLAMMYARGPLVADPHDPSILQHLVAIAVDLGADIIKTAAPHPFAALRELVDVSSIPVVIAGGSPSTANDGDLITFATTSVDHGASGLAVGRRVWGSPDPGRVIRSLSEVLHGQNALMPQQQ